MEDIEEHRCRLFEIEQYICEIEDKKNVRVRCYPFPRIFRICHGRPAVEITALVYINPQTGELNVPAHLSKTLPKGAAWHDSVSTPKSPDQDK